MPEVFRIRSHPRPVPFDRGITWRDTAARSTRWSLESQGTRSFAARPDLANEHWKYELKGKKVSATKYASYAGAEPYFTLVRQALGDLVDGRHFFDVVADNIAYEVLYELGWPRLIRGRRSAAMSRASGSDRQTRLSSTRPTMPASSSSNTKCTAPSSRPAQGTTTASVRSSPSRAARLRTGETTWTPMRPGRR